MLIDTHCHLAFKAFNDNWQDAVKRAREKDVRMIAVGAAKETSEKSITIAREDGVFASVGMHPTHAEDEVWDQEWFSEAANNPKVVAIGECGIDHYHIDESRRDAILQKQEELLRQHLIMAKEKNLPLILHSRDGKTESTGQAYNHLYDVIHAFGYTKGVVHCYGGTWEMAEKFLDLGLMLSFTGIVTYKNVSTELKEVLKNIPKEKFMIETDSPYLTPEPYRGKKNEPAFVEHVARGIAEIRGEEYDDVARQTTENAQKFFNL
jgi:TatD DNase family protein